MDATAMDFAADFTAIDFETASRRPDSACQLGAVVVRGGRIVNQLSWLIKPKPFYFSQFNIGIHGITPEAVEDAATFGDLWPEISDCLFDGRPDENCLVAHNAGFDIGVLVASLRAHRKSIPEIQFTCTRAIARRTWPHRRRYGLKPLSDWLGVRFRHHDALEDSIACAKILLAAGVDRQATSLTDLERRLRVARGRAGDWGHRSPSVRPRRVTANQRSQRGSGASRFENSSAPDPWLELQRVMIRAEFIRPLMGRCVVFSGRLRTLSRQQAESLATRLGADCSAEVDERTDLLVVGSTPRSILCRESTENQQSRAQQLCREGRPIQIVNEAEFLGLVVSDVSSIPDHSS